MTFAEVVHHLSGLLYETPFEYDDHKCIRRDGDKEPSGRISSSIMGKPGTYILFVDKVGKPYVWWWDGFSDDEIDEDGNRCIELLSEIPTKLTNVSVHWEICHWYVDAPPEIIGNWVMENVR